MAKLSIGAIRNIEANEEIVDTPDVTLKKAAELFEERGKQYGPAYLKHGNIMKALFPKGIVLNSSQQFNDFALFELLVVKLNRLSTGLIQGKLPLCFDSMSDISVYSAMLKHSVQQEEKE